MDIFKISTDFSFKNLSAKDGVTGKFYHYKGQLLAGEWVPPSFALVENVALKKSEINSERKLNGNFDARCYGHMFLLKEHCIPHFGSLPLEFLPIIVEDVADRFFFVNVLTVVEAIDFHGLDFTQSMEMLKSESIRFIKKNIGGHMIFRDQKITNFYYCSEQFINLVQHHEITGLRFTKAGAAM